MKEIEQLDLYRKVIDEEITTYHLRDLPVIIFILMSKINEIIRTINTNETTREKNTKLP